jgi:carboxymethylenebutenolidase
MPTSFQRLKARAQAAKEDRERELSEWKRKLTPDDIRRENALRAAQRGDADAVVAYYATLGPDDAGILPCPVLLHLAESDGYRPGSEPDVFASRLRDNGTPVSSHTYVGTGHSFANASLTEKVDGRAAALAFARTTVFLEARLGDAG